VLEPFRPLLVILIEISTHCQPDVKFVTAIGRKLIQDISKEIEMDAIYFAIGTIILVLLMVAARRGLGV
jgi:hypothetical protein